LRKEALVASLIIVSLLGFFPSTCVAATDFEWNEEFDYADIGELQAAGWTLEQPASTYLNGSALVLDGSSVDTVVRYLHFPAGIEDWRAETRSMWIGGYGGTAGVNVVTDQASYSFWIDGWYSRLNFSVNDNTTTFGSYALQLNQWYTLSMEKRGSNISLFLDSAYVYGVDFTTPIGQAVGQAYISPWRGIAQYDYMRFTTQLEDDVPILEWQQTYGGVGIDRGYNAALASDGGYVAIGVTLSDTRGGYDAYLRKLRTDGTQEWYRTYGGASGDWIYSIDRTTDGGYIIAGATSTFTVGSFDLWLLRVDSSGTEVWNRSYGDATRDAGFGVIQTSDGGFAATGYKGSSSTGSDVWLVKVDADGAEEWSRTYGGASEDWGKVLVQTSDGGYAIAGWTQSIGGGATNGYLVRTGADGTMLYDRAYGGTGSTLFYGLLQTSDQGFVLSGHTDTIGNGGMDFYAVRTDADGNVTWEKAYGGSGEDYGYSVFQMDDGFVFGGSGASYHPTLSKIVMVRTDLDGNMKWSASYGPDDMSVSGSIAVHADDGSYMAFGTVTKTVGGDTEDAYAAKLGGTVQPPADESLMEKSAGTAAAVVVGAGAGLVAVAVAGAGNAALSATSGNAAASASGTKSSMIRGFRFQMIQDFVIGYLKSHVAWKAFKKMGKVEPEKGVAQQRKAVFLSFSSYELAAIAFASVMLGLTFMIAGKLSLLDPALLLLYVVFAGLVVIVDDLAHRYVARRNKAVTEYKFWFLGTVIMFVTAFFFGSVFALPGRTIINDTDKLTAKQRAMIYGAGPLMSFTIFLAFMALLPIDDETVVALALLGASMHLLSAVYSFMPFDPMDGNKVFRWKRWVWLAAFAPLLVLYFAMVIWVF